MVFTRLKQINGYKWFLRCLVRIHPARPGTGAEGGEGGGKGGGGKKEGGGICIEIVGKVRS